MRGKLIEMTAIMRMKRIEKKNRRGRIKSVCKREEEEEEEEGKEEELSDEESRDKL